MLTVEVLNLVDDSILVDDLKLGMKFKKMMGEHELTPEDLSKIPQRAGRNCAKKKWFKVAQGFSNEELITLITHLLSSVN